MISMRLIDADALLMFDTWTWFDEWGNFTPAGNLVKNAPTIDAEPVVRCKDCEYWTKQSDSLQGRCALSGGYPTGAWYCANAERRES